MKGIVDIWAEECLCDGIWKHEISNEDIRSLKRRIREEIVKLSYCQNCGFVHSKCYFRRCPEEILVLRKDVLISNLLQEEVKE